MRARTAVRIVAGASAAVALWGLSVQPLARELRVPPRPNVSCDSLNAPTVKSVQVEEGFARATYTTCGARLTGNPPVPGAPWIALLGDSYVEARQVGDDQTVGGRLERMAREAGTPYNVRQYGWAGAQPAQYVAAAKEIMAKWNPRRVVILLSVDDFGDDSARPVDTSGLAPWQPASPPKALALSAMVQHRWSLILERSPQLVRRLSGVTGAVAEAAVAEAAKPGVANAVSALRQAYGDRLLLVYLSTVLAQGDDEAPTERAMMEACSRLDVPCVSLRDAMIVMRAEGRLARGFANTTIGVGHLNADGHDLLAREIWKAVR